MTTNIFFNPKHLLIYQHNFIIEMHQKIVHAILNQNILYTMTTYKIYTCDAI